MELQAIQMGEQAAREAFVEYRRAFEAEHRREDQILMQGYKAIASGKKLIALRETINAGGVDAKGRPKLAIARADWSNVRVRVDSRGSVIFGPTSSISIYRSAGRIALPDRTVPEPPRSTWSAEGRSVVPIIPPQYRPRWSMTNYHILFEAKWAEVPRPDPALLKGIGNGLYAVLAVWDMTPLERAVLGMRNA